MVSWIAGAFAGVVATAGMTLIELAARARWGLAGLLDWQINQTSVARMLKRPEGNLALAGFAFHVLHGLVGGVVFVLALSLVPPSWPVWTLGVGFGALLFGLTLLAFRPITERSARSGPHASAAVAVALLTHLVYGAVLGLLIAWA